MENNNDMLLPDLSQAEVSGTELGAWQYTYNMQDLLISLYEQAPDDDRTGAGVEAQIYDTANMTEDKYNRLLFVLTDNVPDLVTCGRGFSSRDITQHIRKLKE